MKKETGNNKIFVFGILFLLAAVLFLFSSCGKEPKNDKEASFLRATTRLFVNAENVSFDLLERYEDLEYGNVYYYLEANYSRRGEAQTTSGIIFIDSVGSWEFYHSDFLNGISKNINDEYLTAKKNGNGKEIIGEELESLTQRVNEALKEASADTAD